MTDAPDPREDEDCPSAKVCKNGCDQHPPKITVSGNRISITRLDPEGNPVGEPIELSDMINGLSIVLPLKDAEVTDWDMTTDKTLTLELESCSVDPDLIAMLTGQPPSRWRKFISWPRRRMLPVIKRWLHRG